MALLAYVLWFNGLGATTWTLLRAMTQTPQSFTTGVFFLASVWLVVRVVRAVLLPTSYSTVALPTAGPAHIAGAASTSAIPDELRRTLAEHEAAHVVACAARGVEVSKVTVRRNYPLPGSSLGGSVETTKALNLDTPGMASPDNWFDRMVILLAGRAYDDLHGRDPFGSISDYDQSHSIAAMLHRYRTIPAESAEGIFERAAAAAAAIVTAHRDLIRTVGEQVYAATATADTVPAAELRAILSTAAAASRTGGEPMDG
ncbi:hypothetical protein [Tsukamurella spumae]|uniref:Peptidase M41 domain-containing protein n=1 Tax=Tsukamurella spumae TaxID=44753 RepID=A0A846X5L0_9ACTN|nr:hypothetical protein [Tsukamurella spumae]NKY19472.1 hypothetical protein [Tsukamurella spumae]